MALVLELRKRLRAPNESAGLKADLECDIRKLLDDLLDEDPEVGKTIVYERAPCGGITFRREPVAPAPDELSESHGGEHG